jgi:Fe2+ transport system protein FeoA
MPSLYSLEVGDRAVVALPGSTDEAMIAFLDELGLRPGVEVQIREKHPFDGPLVLTVAGQDRTLGDKVARQILVRPSAANPDDSSSAGVAPGDRSARNGEPPVAGTREEQLA